MNSKLKISFKWGLIGGIGVAIFGLCLFILNVSHDSKLNYLGFGILIATILAATYEFRDKEKAGFAKFGELFTIGMLTAAFYALFAAIWGIVDLQFIETDKISTILKETELKLEEQGYDEDVIKQSMAMTKKMMEPTYFFFMGLISALVSGALISVLSGLILRKDAPESFDLIKEESNS